MTPKTSLSAASGKNQNILAPVSLVCGLLAWTLLPIVAALAAILTGHIAYAKDKRLKVGGKGMALTGLVLGYSGLGAAMMLIGIWVGMPEGKSLWPQEAAAPAEQAASAVQAQTRRTAAAQFGKPGRLRRTGKKRQTAPPCDSAGSRADFIRPATGGRSLECRHAIRRNQ